MRNKEDDPTARQVSVALGDRLRARRRELGYLQAAFAHRVGLPDDGTIARIERGEALISETLLRRLVSALDIDWSEIADEVSSDISVLSFYEKYITFCK